MHAKAIVRRPVYFGAYSCVPSYCMYIHSRLRNLYSRAVDEGVSVAAMGAAAGLSDGDPAKRSPVSGSEAKTSKIICSGNT